MNPPDSKIAISLGKIVSVLHKEKLIKDSPYFEQAISSVAKSYIYPDTPPKSSNTDLRQTTIERLLESATKNKEKIENLRKQMQKDKELEITEIPTINKKSKEMVKHK